MTAILQKAAEPSMEEILASIRRIIADDQTRTKPGPANSMAASAIAATALRSREAVPDSATVEAFPSPGKSAQAPTYRGMDDADAQASDAADEAASDEGEAAGTLDSPLASAADASRGPSAAANDARYFPPEAEFQSSPVERPVDRNHNSAPDGRPVAGPASNEFSKQSHNERPRWEASKPQPTIKPAQAPVPHDPVTASAGGQLSRNRSIFDGHASEPQDSPRTALPREPGRAILSGEADAAIGRAFDALRHTVLSDGARPLEELVKEMLRPMLKTWLDDNLPPLVERLVRAEIERVARGRPA